MNNIGVLFSQKIGIFYKDKEWAEDILRKYYDSIPKEIVDKYALNNGRDFIILKNGTFIQCVPANDSSRGYRWDKVIVQNGISDDICDIIIRPKVTLPRIFIEDDNGKFTRALF